MDDPLVAWNKLICFHNIFEALQIGLQKKERNAFITEVPIV